MNAELKRKWIAALRSGEYRQGHGTLRDGSGAMCCLGLLCEVSGLGSWANSHYVAQRNGLKMVAAGDLHGLSSTLGVSGQKQQNLINLNDKRRRSFAEIADFVEANL